MIRTVLSVAGCLLLLAGVARAQSVVVTGFPLGQGSDVNPGFFEPYHPQLQTLADTLRRYPLVKAVITGGADGQRYRRNNHALNPALALGRAHALRNVLVNEFNVDSTQLIIQSQSIKNRGPQYRRATVRIEWGLSEFKVALDNFAAKLDTLANRPPVEHHVTELTEVTETRAENMGLQLSAGVSSSPFGGVPVVAAAVTWKRKVYLEWVAGHALWNSSFRFQGAGLDARRRLTGGQVIVYPQVNIPVGIVGGWMRVEEISKKYYRYGHMSEGPVFGLRVSPHKYLSVTGVYYPASYHLAGDNDRRTRKDKFLLTMSLQIVFGGKR